MHMAVGGACPCGDPLPGRRHHLWDCPAAQAVVAVLRAKLGGRALACADVWLMRAPPGVLPGVWQVVCIAALRGMWVARGALMVPQRRERYAGRTDQQRVQLAERTAVEAFWGVLSDYIRLGQPPRAWRRRLPAGSPFLHFPSPAGGLQVNRR